MEQILIKLQEWIALYGLKVIGSATILFIGRVAAKIVRKSVKRLLEKSRVDVTLASFITRVAYVSMMLFIIIAAPEQLGVKTTSFVAVLGARPVLL